MSNPQISKPETGDVWSNWLLNRDGGSAEYAKILRAHLESIRDRVLDFAQLKEGMTLVDIGTGDGLVAFEAIKRVGPTLTAVFTDVSAPMLEYVKVLADERGVRNQCVFHCCAAESLDELWNTSADVVTTRAALAFVADKPAAFAEFFRVLRPGGRISLAEPILQDEAFESIAFQRLIDASPNHPQKESLGLLQRMRAALFPVSETDMAKSPLTNYSERDLVRFARDAGFVDLHLELHIDVGPTLVKDWQVYLATSPHPWAPTRAQVLATCFTNNERRLFESVMRPMIEQGQSIATDTFAYLAARKPTQTSGK